MFSGSEGSSCVVLHTNNVEVLYRGCLLLTLNEHVQVDVQIRFDNLGTA